MKINFNGTIYYYTTAFEVIENWMDPAAFDALSDDEKEILEGVDDYEYFSYYVMDGSTVIIADGRDGGSIIGRQSLDEFVSDTMEYVRDYVE